MLGNAYLPAYVFFIWPLAQKDSSVSLPRAPFVPAVKMSFHEAAFGKEKLWLPGETHSLGQVLCYLVISHAVTCPFFVTKHN